MPQSSFLFLTIIKQTVGFSRVCSCVPFVLYGIVTAQKWEGDVFFEFLYSSNQIRKFNDAYTQINNLNHGYGKKINKMWPLLSCFTNSNSVVMFMIELIMLQINLRVQLNGA